MARRYIPDLSAFDQFDPRDTFSLQQKFRLIRREFELISAAMSNLETPAPSVLVQSTPNTPGNETGTFEEKNYFVRIWEVFDFNEIPTQEIIASTGLKVNSNGSLKIDGELKII